MDNLLNLTGKVIEITSRTGLTKKGVNYISGEVMVETDSDNIIPVNFFAQEITNAGTENKIYKSLQSVVKDYKTIAAHGRELADVVEIKNGNLSENIFSPDGEKVVRGFKANSNFFNRAKAGAEASNEFIFEGIIMGFVEEVKNDVPTGSLILRLLNLGYNDAPSLLDFIVEDPKAVDYIKNTFSDGQAIKGKGKVVVYEELIEQIEPVAIGDPIITYKRKSFKKLALNSFSAPVESAIPSDRVEAALAKREGDIQTKKAEAKAKNGASAPAQQKGGFSL